MGVNDDREMLEVAKAEVSRLERELATAKITNSEDLQYIHRMEKDLPVAVIELQKAGIRNEDILSGAASAAVHLALAAATSIPDAANILGKGIAIDRLHGDDIARYAETLAGDLPLRAVSETNPAPTPRQVHVTLSVDAEIVADMLRRAHPNIPVFVGTPSDIGVTKRELRARLNANRDLANDTLGQLAAAHAILTEIAHRWADPDITIDQFSAALPELLNRPKFTALAKVKADVLREAALRQPWFGVKGDDFMTWLNEEADRIEKEADHG